VLRSFDRRVFPGRGAPPLNADGSLHESPPAAFGPFRVLHQVGAGSLGPVFRAHDPVEGRLVAIKAFRLEATPEQAAELAVELEDLAANQPRHPGIAAALAAGVAGTTPYLAQEYVAGEALDAVIRQFGPPPPAEALTTLRRVAEALDRAAGEGIHHGMLHPRDILIAEGGEARVIDLGVAQALERSGLRVPVRRPYSAPERVAESAWGGPADIFSLGAIAYELLTGRRLPGTGRPDVQAPSLTPPSAGQVDDVLARALDADAAARFPSAADLVDALAALLPAGRRTGRKRTRVGTDAAMPLPLEATEAVAGPEAAEPMLAPLEAPPPGPGPDLPLDDPPPPRFVSLDDEPEAAEAAATAATVPPAEAAPAAGSWPPAFAPAAAAPERRSLRTLLIAVLVGIAAGFGWGYWTAYRTLTRPASLETASAGEPPVSAASTAPVRVDEPEVIGERGLPSPAARPQAPAASARTAASATVPAAAPRAAPQAPAPAPAPERRAAPLPRGRLVVRSTPPGARVRVDGRVRGRTPLVLRDLPLRVVQVTLERDGFTSDQRRVALTAAQPTVTIDARLASAAPPAPAATTGTLVIESRPAGATVFLNGRAVGTTPMSVPETAPGTHRIRLEMAGFSPWLTTAAVQAGARTRVAASLERGTPE
jgi:serine/threonine-protein kinase